MLKLFQTLIDWVKPPPQWRIGVIVCLGMLAGTGIFIVHISRAFSYLSDDPEACINCHIMRTYFSSWFHSPHRNYATCNDCHIPQNNFINKYYFKARNGLFHSTIFTLHLEPQSIQISEAAKYVVSQNCVRCHSSLFNNPGGLKWEGSPDNPHSSSALGEKGEAYCWSCHRETPHGRRASIASTPDAQTPSLGSMVPSWLKSK